MKLLAMLVQSVIYSFVVNATLSVYGFILGFSMQQLAEFMSLTLALSLVLTVVFWKLPRFVRMFISGILISSVLSFYFSFIHEVSISYLMLSGILFADYLIAFLVTFLIFQDRYDDESQEA